MKSLRSNRKKELEVVSVPDESQSSTDTDQKELHLYVVVPESWEEKGGDLVSSNLRGLGDDGDEQEEEGESEEEGEQEEEDEEGETPLIPRDAALNILSYLGTNDEFQKVLNEINGAYSLRHEKYTGRYYNAIFRLESSLILELAKAKKKPEEFNVITKLILSVRRAVPKNIFNWFPQLRELTILSSTSINKGHIENMFKNALIEVSKAVTARDGIQKEQVYDLNDPELVDLRRIIGRWENLSVTITQCPSLKGGLEHLAGIRSLTLESCNNISMNTFSRMALKRVNTPGLRQLSVVKIIKCATFTDLGAAVFVGAKTVKIIGSPLVTDAIFVSLEECADLEIDNAPLITGSGLSHLRRIKEIKLINCSALRDEVDDPVNINKPISCLLPLRTAKKVSLFKCPRISDFGIAELKGVSDLSVSDNGNISDDGFAEWNSLDGIYIRDCPQVVKFRFLRQFSTLTKCAITLTKKSISLERMLASAKQITELNLVIGRTLLYSECEFVGSLSTLRVLRLTPRVDPVSRVVFEDHGVRNCMFAKLRNLKTLRLRMEKPGHLTKKFLQYVTGVEMFLSHLRLKWTFKDVIFPKCKIARIGGHVSSGKLRSFPNVVTLHTAIGSGNHLLMSRAIGSLKRLRRVYVGQCKNLEDSDLVFFKHLATVHLRAPAKITHVGLALLEDCSDVGLMNAPNLVDFDISQLTGARRLFLVNLPKITNACFVKLPKLTVLQIKECASVNVRGLYTTLPGIYITTVDIPPEFMSFVDDL